MSHNNEKISVGFSDDSAKSFLAQPVFNDIAISEVKQNGIKSSFPFTSLKNRVETSLSLEPLSDLFKYKLFCGTPRAKDYKSWGQFLTSYKQGKIKYYVCKSIAPHHLKWNQKISSLGKKVENAVFDIESAGLNNKLTNNFLSAPKILIRGNDYRMTSAIDIEGSVFVGVYGLIPNNYLECIFISSWINSSFGNFIYLYENCDDRLSGGYASINSPHINGLLAPNFDLKLAKNQKSVVESNLSTKEKIKHIDELILDHYNLDKSILHKIFNFLPSKFRY